MTLTPDTVLAQGTDHVETVVGDQVMMMSIAQGKYYALEGPARRIWELLKQPSTLESVVQRLVEEYEIAREDCLKDTKGFVTDLMQNGLIVEQPGETGA